MRKPWVVAAAGMAVAVVALLLVSALQSTSLAFTLGVQPAFPVVELERGQQVCQGDIEVPPGAGFDRVRLKVDPPSRDVRVEVVDAAKVAVVARGDLGASRDVARVGDVPEKSKIRVCVANRGSRVVRVYGNPDVAAPPTTAMLDGNPTGADVALVFERESRSRFSLIGAMADRASLFKVSWFGGWTFWLLGLAVLLAVPVLLVRALRGLEE